MLPITMAFTLFSRHFAYSIHYLVGCFCITHKIHFKILLGHNIWCWFHKPNSKTDWQIRCPIPKCISGCCKNVWISICVHFQNCGDFFTSAAGSRATHQTNRGRCYASHSANWCRGCHWRSVSRTCRSN